MAKSPLTINALTAIAAITAGFLSSHAVAQNLTVSPAQRETAKQVAQSGVPLSELSPSAPDSHTVKRGDTLWGISKLFLKGPWRWPELWGMNMEDIKNPHRIYPGQTLVLDRNNGVARLRFGAKSANFIPTETIVVSPRTRYEKLADDALPTLRTSLIEPFLAEPVIVDEAGLSAAPRIVSAQDGRVLLTRGDRAYVRGQNGVPLLDDKEQLQQFRVFRDATPLKDPVTAEILGYEAIYVGKATLIRGESTTEVENKDGTLSTAVVPATIDIIAAKEEMRVGDRLLPEPQRLLATYTPHVPQGKVEGRIVSVYGSAVVNAAQNQVVVINRGTQDGMEPGHVMAILKDGARFIDKSDPAKALIKLPDERNGLLMVFRSFERLSYALVLEITDGVQIGDRLTAPR